MHDWSVSGDVGACGTKPAVQLASSLEHISQGSLADSRQFSCQRSIKTSNGRVSGKPQASHREPTDGSVLKWVSELETVERDPKTSSCHLLDESDTRHARSPQQLGSPKACRHHLQAR